MNRSNSSSRSTVVPMDDVIPLHKRLDNTFGSDVSGHHPLRGSMVQLGSTEMLMHTHDSLAEDGVTPAWAEEKVMVDSEQTISFKWGVFFKEWAYNSLGFVLLPLMFVLEGYHGTRNRGFAGNYWLFWWQLVNFLVIYAIVVLWFVAPETHESVSPFEVINTILHTTFAAFVIGVKYAYLPAKEYEEMSVAEPLVDQTERQFRRQLLTGWIQLSPETISVEMARAAHRARVATSRLYLEEKDDEKGVDLSAQFAKSIATGVSRDPVTDNHTVNIKQVVGEILLSSIRAFNITPYSVSLMVVSTALALIPSIIRVATGKPFLGESVTSAVLIVCIVVIQSIFVSRNEMFLLTAIVDLYRRRVTMQALNDLITTGFVSTSLEGYVSPLQMLTAEPEDEETANKEEKEQTQKVLSETSKPYIADLSIPRNVTTWLEARRLLLEFGKRYYDRIQAFVFYVATILVVFTVYLVLTFFFPAMQIDFTGMVVIVIQAVLFTTVVFVCIIIGGSINNYAHVHEESLLRAALELRCRIHDEHVAGGDVAGMVDAQQLLELTVKAVENQRKLRPVRFLGMTASAGAARAALTIGLSGILSGLRVIAGV